MSGFQDWQTPNYLYNFLNFMYDFNLDVACTTLNCKCKEGIFIDEGDDGLKSEWFGNVFCNPPWKETSKWVKKAYYEVLSKNCETATLVIPASTDTNYFFDYILYSSQIYFLKGRVNYIDPRTGKEGKSPRQPTMIVHFGGSIGVEGLDLKTMEIKWNSKNKS